MPNQKGSCFRCGGPCYPRGAAAARARASTCPPFIAQFVTTFRPKPTPTRESQSRTSYHTITVSQSHKCQSYLHCITRRSGEITAADQGPNIRLDRLTHLRQSDRTSSSSIDTALAPATSSSSNTLCDFAPSTPLQPSRTTVTVHGWPACAAASSAARTEARTQKSVARPTT